MKELEVSESLIDYYKAIEDGSSKMLAAAKSEDWDSVVHYEGVCAVLIEQLRFKAKNLELDASAKAEKSKIMLRILGNDAQVRYLAEPWLPHFEAKFQQQCNYLH